MRQRRREPATTVASKPPVNADLDSLLTYLRDVKRKKEYDLLGRLIWITVLREDGVKTVDFRTEGPVIGMIPETDQLIAVTEWQGIPVKREISEQPCSSCLTGCDVCKDGKKLCELCGGARKTKLPFESCPAAGCLKETDKPKAGCVMCRGTGIFQPFTDCKVCAGSGQMTCPVCRGTGKRPTGIEGGSTDWKKPNCSACHGIRFQMSEKSQDVTPLINKRLGSMVALGPIVRFAVLPVGGSGEPTEVFEVLPDATQNYLALVLESEQPGSEMFFTGGVVKSREEVHHGRT